MADRGVQNGNGEVVCFRGAKFYTGIINYTFINVSTEVAGGAVAAGDTDLLTVHSTTFINNLILKHGGVLYLPGQGLDFISNWAF